MKKNKFGTVYLSLIFVVLYLPIFYLVAFSFNAGETMNKFTGFSLVHFQELFSDNRLLIILLQTFLLAFLSALLATVIGICGTLWIKYARKRAVKNSLLAANNVLLVSPDVIIGASFLILFTVTGHLLHGFGLGFLTVLLSHVAFSVPIVVLMILPQLEKMNESLIFAAYDLGASPWQALVNVVLPYLNSGIIAGYFMAFTYSLDDFAVTFFVTGGGFTTLSVEIYSRARQGVSLEVNALSTLVFLLALVLVAGYYFISKEDSGHKNNHKKRG